MKKLSYEVTNFHFEIGRIYKKNEESYIFLGYVLKDMDIALEDHYRSVLGANYGMILTAKKDDYLYWTIGLVFYPLQLQYSKYNYDNALLLYGYEVENMRATDQKTKLQDNLKNIDCYGSKLICDKEVRTSWETYLNKLKMMNLIPTVKEKVALFENHYIQSVAKSDLIKGNLYMNDEGIYIMAGENELYMMDRIVSPANKMSNYKKFMFYYLCGRSVKCLHWYKLVSKESINARNLVVYKR